MQLSTHPTEQLDRARRVIADLRKRLAGFQAAGSEAIAVIGMACRFPGEARDVGGYWTMVAAGRSATRPIPPDRARHMAADGLRPVALLDDIESFDAAFFDISPREAVQMDPQQRLFLEVAWEALEDAGQTRSDLGGSPTGVFVGVHNHSSGYLELQTAEASSLNQYSGTGSGHDVIAGRLAYVLDLRGPSIVINTACSSSLVAVHIACQSLLSRDCRTAVAGGVNLILGSVQSRIAGLAGMLAADGQCKTFDARADGYGRGEGCGVVVLKRLSDAVSDRDRILAVIRGSVVNQDGRTNGLTAPSGLAQQALLRRALARAGLDASRIGYVEAHGTGTALGDPIEVEALATVYGVPVETGARCALGSAKANINHLEGAAGIAGLIKTILTLRARMIPPVAGFERLNPHLSLDGTRLFIPTEATEWRSEAPRVAAVSAFGWSGTNAHLLIEEAPERLPQDVVRPTVIMVSASDPAALSARASALADALQGLPDETLLESFAWTSTARRSHYRFRSAVAGRNRVELAEALREAVGRGSTPSSETPPKIGFLIGDDTVAAAAFWAELMAGEEVFRSVVAACAAAFEAAGEKAISAALAGPGAASVADPVRCFVFASGVAAVLERWGVRPVVIAGWGIGSSVAAHLSSNMTLADAVRRVARERDVPDGSPAAAGLAMSGTDYVVRLDKLVRKGGAAVADGSARWRLMQILADLAAAGLDPAWDEIFGPAVELVDLPAHRFRRRRHWVAEPPPREAEPFAASVDVPGDWFFETLWRPEESSPEAGDLPRRWLILGEAQGPAAQLAAQLRAADGIALEENSAGVDGGRLADLMGRGRWTLVDLRALDRRTGNVAAEAMRLSRQVVALDQTLDRAPSELQVELWLVTRGAQGVVPGESPDLASAPLWGLARSLTLDHPERWGGFIDLDPTAAFDAGQLAREIGADGGEADEVAFRAERRYVNRVVPAPAPAADTLRLDPAATYLVTGAFGGIGPALAVWLARRGARSLVLSGRSLDEGAAATDPSQLLMRQLQEMGVEVRLRRR
jgi:acyl transferase domain-containing protein